MPISILGSGVEPRLVFTPKEVDFGMCFLQQAEMSPRRTTVVITNKEKEDMRLVTITTSSLYNARYAPGCVCLALSLGLHRNIAKIPCSFTQHQVPV